MMSVYGKRANRLSLSMAQRRVIDDNDELGWLGWDAARLPVVQTGYRDEPIAIDRDGGLVEPTPPIEELTT